MKRRPIVACHCFYHPFPCALHQICGFSEAEDAIKVLTCLNDKVLDIVFNPPPRNDTVLRSVQVAHSGPVLMPCPTYWRVPNKCVTVVVITPAPSLRWILWDWLSRLFFSVLSDQLRNVVNCGRTDKSREWVLAVLNDILPALVARVGFLVCSVLACHEPLPAGEAAVMSPCTTATSMLLLS